MGDAEGRIEAGDTGLFTVETSTSQGDRASLLALQSVVRRAAPNYSYIEVGSYLGGTLVPHLLDPACRLVLSIDTRADGQPDERARYFSYQGVTTAGMLDLLRPAVPPASLAKLRTFDADASALPPSTIGTRAALALIDGEHTTTAAFSDFLALYPVLEHDAIVAFHDSNLVIDAIRNVERFLRFHGVDHSTFFLPDWVAAVALRGFAAPSEARLRPLAHDTAVFGRNAKIMLHEAIAQAVADGAHREL